ncbi:MAG: outer membrane protein assembly factor BamA [Planctomycetota bacterium]|jgi:outer membrane protein assembly complex protein YaeT
MLLSSGFSQEIETPVSDRLVISKITTAGNLNIRSAQILSTIRSRTGDFFDESIIAEDVKRIGQIKGVQYSYYNTNIVDNNVELTFVIVEQNLIRSINFIGNKKFKSKKLRKKLDFKIGDYLDLTQAQAGTAVISEMYKKKGYAFVEVQVDSEEISKGRVTYNVTEGPRVRIVSVRFAGNDSFSTRKLKKVIKTKKRKWLIFRNYYQDDIVTNDEIELVNAYQRQGFLNTIVTARRDFTADYKQVNITFAIDEGKLYTLDSINITGNSFYDEQKLKQGFKSEVGQTYIDPRADSDAKSILSMYQKEGFVDAKVRKERIFLSEDEVRLDLVITEGQRVRIGQVNISGNKETHDKVFRNILNEYDFKPGLWYNADTARGDGTGYLEKKVRQMAMPQSVEIKPVGDKENERDAQVNIVEGQTGMVMLGVGLGSDSGVIGQLVFEQRNFDIFNKPESFYDFITGKAFKGAGQTLRISMQPGTEVSQYSISFTEPYLNNKPLSLNVTALNWERYRESYDEERLKGAFSLEKRFKSKWRRSIAFRAENVKVKDIDLDAPIEIKDEKGNNNLYGVKFGISRDMTNDPFIPTAGYTFSVTYEQVTGDYDFGILQGIYRRYQTLYEDLAERKTVLATKLLAATVTSSDTPTFEKFYGGGTGLYGIRGFEYRGVSTRGLPTDAAGDPIPGAEPDDPIGSDWIFLATAEVIVPLASENFSALFFVDSGTIDTGSYRAAVGAGIQILIPQWFGPVPMRFELASSVLDDDLDDTQAFSFSVGRLF